MSLQCPGVHEQRPCWRHEVSEFLFGKVCRVGSDVERWCPVVEVTVLAIPFFLFRSGGSFRCAIHYLFRHQKMTSLLSVMGIGAL